jgi:hypothetical protein
MNRAIPVATACQEALSRLPTLNIGELRQQWRSLYKTQAPPTGLDNGLILDSLSRLFAVVNPGPDDLRRRARQQPARGYAGPQRPLGTSDRASPTGSSREQAALIEWGSSASGGPCPILLKNSPHTQYLLNIISPHNHSLE